MSEYHQFLEMVKVEVIDRKALNPICDDYDHAELVSCINAIAQLQSPEVKNGSLFQALVSETLYCFEKLNIAFEDLMEKIEKTLDWLALANHVLIEKCLMLTNFQFLGATEILDTDKIGDSRRLSLAGIESPKRSNIFGDEIFLQDAVDISVDSFNTVVDIITSYNNGLETNVEKGKLRGIQTLFIASNALYLLKDLFDQYLREFKCIVATDGKIKFTYLNDYGYLKRVGKRRYEGHHLESSRALKLFHLHLSSSSLHTLRNGVIMFSDKDLDAHAEYMQSVLSVLIYYKAHITGQTLPRIGGATIHDIFRVITGIQLALQKLVATTSIREQLKAKGFKESPLKVDKKSLTQYLIKLTKLSAKKINSILSCLCSNFSAKGFDSWKTPFISYQGQYYCVLGAITMAHVGNLMDSIVSKCNSIRDENLLFSRFVRRQIEDKDHQYPLPVLESPDVSDPNFFQIQLDQQSVAIQCTIYRFPVSTGDYGDALRLLANAADTLNENIYVANHATGTSEQPFKMIVCNYPFLSGIAIGNCYVVDVNLLNNYISTGSYSRGKLVLSEGFTQVGMPIILNYYATELEFKNRFVDFFQSPIPITETLPQFTEDLYPVAKEIIDIEIVNEEIRDAIYEEMEEEEIQRVQELLRNLYYFDDTWTQEENEEAQSLINSRIQFHLPYAFSIVGFESKNRAVRIKLINSINETRLHGLSYTLSIVNKLTVSTLSRRPKLSPKRNRVKVDTELAIADYEVIMNSLANGNEVKVSLSTISITAQLDDDRRINLIEFLLPSLNEILESNLHDLESHYFTLNIIAGLHKEKDTYNIDFIKACFNLLDQLNNTYYYQKARNFAEEILKYYCDKVETPLIGWLLLMRCYTKQNNIPDAACYAALLLSVADSIPSLEADLHREICYNLMLFYRGFGQSDMMNSLFQILKTTTQSEYELHKIHLSYFMGLMHSDVKELEQHVHEIKEYLSEHLNEIVTYGQHGAIPWTALVYNIKNIIEAGKIEDDDFWNEVLISLKSQLSEVTLARLGAMFFDDKDNTIQAFKTALLHTFETVDIEDLAFEIDNLSLLANNAIRIALASNDINSLLLAGLVVNDQTLTFQLKPWQEYTQFDSGAEFELRKHIDNYRDFALDPSILLPGQCIYWIFNFYSEVYCLVVERENLIIEKISNWDLTKMRVWHKKLGQFIFPSGQDYFINQQEDDYIKTLQTLQDFKIPVTGSCSEVLLYNSLDTAIYPHNLLTIDTTLLETVSFIHEERVKQKVDQLHTDFALLYVPVTNIGSLEWFKDNCGRVEIDHVKYSIELWCPVEDEDFVLNLTLENVRPAIANLPVKNIFTSVIPAQPPSSNFNVFIAHGGKGYEGFKTIYTKHEGGTAFIKQSGTSTLFGNGDVALVFICNSAFTSKETFSERLVSFTSEILMLGYKAIVAPAWSLNPDIVPHWLQAFFRQMEDGSSIARAVHLANRYVAKHGYNDYNGYYSPSGWACMHLFGNPNIYFTA